MNLPIILVPSPPKASDKSLDFKTQSDGNLENTHGVGRDGHSHCLNENFSATSREELIFPQAKFLPNTLLYFPESLSLIPSNQRRQIFLFGNFQEYIDLKK